MSALLAVVGVAGTWLLAGSTAIPAGGGTGTLRVCVSDAESGRLVPFWSVLVIGTSAEGHRDTTACAPLVNLPAGQWIVKVQVIRRNPEIDTVTIAAGQVTSARMEIKPLAAGERCVLEVRPIRARDWSQGRYAPCVWKAVSTRPADPSDVPYDTGVAMLDDPEPPNSAPGPGRLRAVVRLKGRRGLYVEDDSSGASRFLLRANLPKWSPDGRWIACTVYGSPSAPYHLALVEPASGRVWYPHLGAPVGEYRWSPDAQRLALELRTAWGDSVWLGFFSVSAGTFAPVDTLTLPADFDFRWSPDSRTLAVSKPTLMDASHTDEVAHADLWLMDVSGARCRLVEGQGFLAVEPRWIDSKRIRYERSMGMSDSPESTAGLVVSVARSK